MISTKGRYALRVMIDLARHTPGPPVALKDIAERQRISKKYLEIIVRDLVSGGLIAGVSGKGGGYRLCREPGAIPVGEILEMTEGSLSSVACLSTQDNPCPNKSMCPTLPLWEEYNSLTRSFFFSKKLSDLISGD